MGLLSLFKLANPLTLAIKIKVALIVMALLACVAASLYGVHRLIVNDEVRIARIEEDKKLNDQYNAQLQKSIQNGRARERELQEDKAKAIGDRDAKIATINVQLDHSLRELRNRPERSATSDVRPSSDSGIACTGPQLYRNDAEFLTRYAAAARAVDTDRLSCYRRLEDQARTVNKPPG